MVGTAVQIVAQEEGKGFNVTESLQQVLGRVPAGATVSVLSVVGAFRSGKSFLLSLMLRFLRHRANGGVCKGPFDSEWMTAEGDSLTEGNVNEGEGTESARSFPWRGGQARQTLGIWMWSEPFVVNAPDGSKVALLLMDTQGMFDNETSMTLTAQIFGLSTLVSSLQVSL